MTEKEAIEIINHAISESENTIANLSKVKELAERKNIIGEYYSNIQNCKKEIESCKTATKALEEIQRYREIGTVEECRSAAEKQKPKKPAFEGDGYDDKGEIIYDTWICPNCEARYEVDYDDYDFCPKCGQRLMEG